MTEHRRTPDEIDKTALACGLVASTLAQVQESQDPLLVTKRLMSRQIGMCRDFFALGLKAGCPRLSPAEPPLITDTHTLPAVLCQVAAYPFDLLRRQMQVCPNPQTLREAWRANRKSNGGAGLYKGLPILLLKNVPLTFISFTVRASPCSYHDIISELLGLAEDIR